MGGAIAPRGAAGLAGTWASLNQGGRLVVAGGLGAAVLALLGIPLANAGTIFALVVALAGFWAAFAAVTSRWSGPPWPVSGLTTAVWTVWLLAALAGLNAIELLAHLGEMAFWGGIIGAVITLAMAAAAGAALVGLRGGGVLGTASPAGGLAPFAIYGFWLFIAGWIGLVVLSWPSAGANAILIAAVVLATVFTVRPGLINPPILLSGLLALPALAAAWLTLTMIGAELSSTDLSPITDWLPFLVMVAGTAIVVGLATMTALASLAPSSGAKGR